MRDNHPGSTRPPSRPARLRRSRQPAPRPRTIRFGLTDDEFADLEAAAARAGMARGAYAAGAALAAARGTSAGPDEALRDVLAELVRAAGLVRRIGLNLNQAVARLNSTGQHSGDLAAYAAESIRRSRHLDEIADLVRRTLR